MKSAQEMFEELGYIYKDPRFKVHVDRYFYYVDIFKDNIIIIYLKEKDFMADCNCKPMDINMPTFKAIHQQLEELGWLEE